VWEFNQLLALEKANLSIQVIMKPGQTTGLLCKILGTLKIIKQIRIWEAAEKLSNSHTIGNSL
jgi:hypothetical protein